MNPCYRRLLMAFLVVSAPLSSVFAVDSARYELTIDAGKLSRDNVPVRVDVAVPTALKDATQASIRFADGRQVVAQVMSPSLLSKPMGVGSSDVHRQLCFILDHLDAGQSLSGEATIADKLTPDTVATFAWTDTAGKYSDLSFAGRPVLRYMYEPLDESNPVRRAETFKVYHHVFSPDGSTLLTKGPGGLFTHHRGLFFGFNRVAYDQSKKADVWHCTGKAYQSHDGIESSVAGPVLGRHRVKVGWHGQQGETFADEERELTVYRQAEKDGKPTGTLIEFASTVRTKDGDIVLDGDPQHAGFHFRASQEVPDRTKDKTYYVRVDGVGKPGEFRNWPDQKDQVNFPWKGLSFMLGGERYTVANLDRPENPKESRFSERDYGRFGSYFQYTISENKPLEVNYRIWVQPGEMTVDQIDAMAKDFTGPPSVTIKRI